MNKDNISGALMLILPFVIIALFPSGKLSFIQIIFLIVFCWSFGIYGIVRGNKKEKENQLERERIKQIEKDKNKIEAEKLIKEKEELEKKKAKKILDKKRRQESFEREKQERERLLKLRNKKINKLLEEKDQIVKKLDKDNNGLVDITEIDDFMKLLKKHQNKIIETDPKYISDLVKVSEHLKLKKNNIQTVFDKIKDENRQDLQLERLFDFLNTQINLHNVLLFHSINMIGAIINDDLITFNEIYFKFDKLDIFNSNWENNLQSRLENLNNELVKVKSKLSEINIGINKMNQNFKELIYNVHEMERNITSELSNLSYTIDYGNSELNNSLTKELENINSGIAMNNLLTGIQAYQTYKINGNTKNLRN